MFVKLFAGAAASNVSSLAPVCVHTQPHSSGIPHVDFPITPPDPLIMPHFMDPVEF